MTIPAGHGAADALARARARIALIRTVRDRLKGQGLDVRELAKELVISSPGHPERGRVYITYATAEVSHRRTTWDYLGHLTGHGSEPNPDEPTVDLDKIIATLRLGHPGAERIGQGGHRAE